MAPRALGRYELVRCVGGGGMGIVHEAIDRALGRRVAVKVMREGVDPVVASARFLREAKAAAMVRHPNVVGIFDVGVEDGIPFLVMEFVDGETLAQRVLRKGRLPLRELLDIALPIVSGVAELHAAGIVHRDLKPANILLARGARPAPKIVDFGISRLDDGAPAITRSETILGTLEYMSPEQMRSGARATEASDQYALGVILYECLTGTRPYRGGSHYELMHAIVTGGAPSPSALEVDVPERIDAIVMRALEVDPERRYANVEELGDALLGLATQSVELRWRDEFATEARHAEPLDDTPTDFEPKGFTRPERATEPRARRLAPIVATCALVALVGTFGRGLTEPPLATEGTPPPADPALAVPASRLLSSAVPAVVDAPQTREEPVTRHLTPTRPVASVVRASVAKAAPLVAPIVGDNGALILAVP